MFIKIIKAGLKIIPAIATSAVVFSNSLFVGATALALTSVASAQELVKVDFRYDKSLLTEENYAVFEKTARRACDDGSNLVAFGQEKACRADLLNQVVAKTMQPSFVAYHQQMILGSKKPTSLTNR